MSNSKTPILFIGATGYVGSTVLSRLLTHPKRDTFEITALVRSAEKAKKLEAFGVIPVVGSYNDDTALVENLAQNAHIVFLAVLPNPDDVDGTNALLAGLKKRHAQTGDVPILIHTSGTGVLSSGDAVTHGLRVSEKIYYDDQPEELERAIASAVIQRKNDEVIIKAGKEQYLRSYIVIPGLIWGVAKNPLVDAGIANAYSKGLHLLIQIALDRGQPGIIGTGQIIWPSVNIEEQGDFYVLLLDAILSNPEKVGHGPNSYYFGENGDYLWYDALKAIGKALAKRGLSPSEEPTPLTSEEIKKFFGLEELATLILGANSRARAPHARSLGWQPKLGTQEFLDSIDAEVEVAIELRKKFTKKEGELYPSY